MAHTKYDHKWEKYGLLRSKGTAVVYLVGCYQASCQALLQQPLRAELPASGSTAHARVRAGQQCAGVFLRELSLPLFAYLVDLFFLSVLELSQGALCSH